MLTNIITKNFETIRGTCNILGFNILKHLHAMQLYRAIACSKFGSFNTIKVQQVSKLS